MNPYALLMFVSGISCCLLGIHSIRKWALFSARVLFFLMFAIALWSIAYGLELMSTELQTMQIFTKISYPGITSVPVLFFLFVMAILDLRKWFSSRRIVLLFVVPLVTTIAMWTNELHHLFYRVSALDTEGPFPVQMIEYGPVFWIMALYSYIMLVAGLLFLIREWSRTEKPYRKQLSVILAGAIIPFVINAAYLARLIPVGHVDLTPVGFSVAAVFLSISIFGLKLLDIRPIAKETLIERLEHGIVVIDNSRRIVDTNPAACRFLDISGSNVLGVLYDDAFSHVTSLVEFLGSEGSKTEISVGDMDFELRKTPVSSSRGKLRGYVVQVADVTERKRNEEALIQSEEQLSLALKGGKIGLWDWKIKANEIEFNERYVQIIGLASEEVHLSFQAWQNLIHPDDLVPTLEALQRCYDGGSNHFESEYRMLSKTGEWIWVYDRGEVAQRDEEGSPMRIVGTHIDITSRKLVEEALRKSQELYKKLATTDMLTEVMNRYSLGHALDVETERARRYEQSLSLVLFDVDDLKVINDNHGHLAGDEALKALATYVKSSIRKSDYFGRWGGDEFLIVAPGIDLDGALEMAEKLRKGLSSEGVQGVGKLSISIGVASLEKDDSDYDDVLRRADRALYESKKKGKDTTTFV